ncbi:MAG: type II toxin-antitoxin system RelE/ParE family toxin [Candidatus Sumerlaeaceae bacterium]|nr:type II toxin-antitoxin system RelE/ParE family toxin [Candidatus Sumerlaeaceae bacterium]
MQKAVWTECLANSNRAYRVIYEIHDGKLFVLVVAIGHRREIYR